MNVLLIEDDEETRDSLQTQLTGRGYDVQTSSDGEDGFTAARAGCADLILLDVMLPMRDGFSILESLRAAGDRTPVLVTTARDAIEDRVRGLEAGADDYVVKPFAFDELAARIKTLLRRAPSAQRDLPTIRIGDLEVDLCRQRSSRAGRRLDLTPKEFALLSLLVRRRAQTLSRQTIAEQLWEDPVDNGTNVVDVHVRRLRAKLDDPFDQKLIRTVRGVGYVLRDH